MSHLPVGFREMNGLPVDAHLAHFAMTNGRPEPKGTCCWIEVNAFFWSQYCGYGNTGVLEGRLYLIFLQVPRPVAEVLIKYVLMVEPVLERCELFFR